MTPSLPLEGVAEDDAEEDLAEDDEAATEEEGLAETEAAGEDTAGAAGELGMPAPLLSMGPV